MNGSDCQNRLWDLILLVMCLEGVYVAKLLLFCLFYSFGEMNVFFLGLGLRHKCVLGMYVWSKMFVCDVGFLIFWRKKSFCDLGF